MVSSYHWWLQKASEFNSSREDAERIKHLGSFTSFMHSKYGKTRINQFKGSIHDWISEKDEIIVDFVGRFQNMNEDWKTVYRHLGIPLTELPHRNRSERKNYREYYTEETKEIVAKRFQKTIQLFGYEF